MLLMFFVVLASFVLVYDVVDECCCADMVCVVYVVNIVAYVVYLCRCWFDLYVIVLLLLLVCIATLLFCCWRPWCCHAC